MPILSLSNELLVGIFLASPTVHDALRLSGTIRLLHDIFIEHETLIMEGILRPQIPAFDDAAALAVTETSFLDIKGPTSLSPDGPLLPLRYCIPRLLRNAELASSACAECAADRNSTENKYGMDQDHLIPLLESYYFIRQMVLAYDFRQLRDPLYARLRTASTEWINERNKLLVFLVYEADWIYQHRHRIRAIPDEWTADDIKAYPGELFTKNNWEFADNLITDASMDREYPGSALEMAIWAYSR